MRWCAEAEGVETKLRAKVSTSLSFGNNKREISYCFSFEVLLQLFEDATFGASEVFGGAYFWEKFLELWSGVWSLEWCYHC